MRPKTRQCVHVAGVVSILRSGNIARYAQAGLVAHALHQLWIHRVAFAFGAHAESEIVLSYSFQRSEHYIQLTDITCVNLSSLCVIT